VFSAGVSVDPDHAELVKYVGAATARRVDDLCMAGLALTPVALEAAKLPAAELAASNHVLLLGTALGCLESDYVFSRELTELGIERVGPRRFAYTLPSVVLGEVTIQHKLHGESLVLSAGRASAISALVRAAQLIESGRHDAAIVYAIDVAGEGTKKLFDAAKTEPRPIAAAFVLEAEEHAKKRGAPIRSRILRAESGAAPVRDVLPARDPLGADGVAELLAALGRSANAKIAVECPTGYRAELEVDTP
jgi:3-oxoacyl-(acyl-carrier-protein) synthase